MVQLRGDEDLSKLIQEARLLEFLKCDRIVKGFEHFVEDSGLEKHFVMVQTLYENKDLRYHIQSKYNGVLSVP